MLFPIKIFASDGKVSNFGNASTTACLLLKPSSCKYSTTARLGGISSFNPLKFSLPNTL